MVTTDYPEYVAVPEPEDSRYDFRGAAVDISESIPPFSDTDRTSN